MFSVIIPTLDEAACLQLTLRAIGALDGGRVEVVCADGGSMDGTAELAERLGARVVRAARGRGGQLDAGAREARGEVLWFLHADTLIPPDAIDQLAAAIADERVVAGNFRLRFAGSSRGARFLNGLYPKLAWLGLRYGDSGLWVRRETYERAGGFRPLPIFEDLDFLRRVRPLGGFRTLPGPLVTSSRRFESRSFPAVFTH